MSVYKDQKDVKPKIEDVAGEYLSAERTADLLNLVEFIRVSKIGLQWASGNSWALIYKGKRLGHLMLYYYDIQSDYEGSFGKPHPLHKSWFFYHKRDGIDRYYGMQDGDLKAFIFDNIYANNCGHCFCSWHMKGKNEMDEQKAGYMNPTDCRCWPLRVYNPAGEALELTKRLIEFRMKCIMEDSSKK